MSNVECVMIVAVYSWHIFHWGRDQKIITHWMRSTAVAVVAAATVFIFSKIQLLRHGHGSVRKAKRCVGERVSLRGK